jgi:hypothetical protein
VPVPEPESSSERAFADAERLVREAQRAAEDAVRAAGGDVPPRGWAAPGGAAEPGTGAAPGPAGFPGAFPDLSGIGALLEAVRGTVPPELGQQLSEALRGLLVALRAVLDFYIARLDPPPAAPPDDVQDIPVE